MTRMTGILAIAIGLLFTAAAVAQTPSTSPSAQSSLKAIGVPTAAKSEIEPALIVLNSRNAMLQGDKLTLTGVSPNAIVFADRPVRAAGHALTVHLLEEWAANDSFGKDPPNATVSAVSKDGLTNRDAVVVLKSPKLDGDRLTFDVQVLEGNLNGADGPAAVFIDIIGLPFTPLSYAGVARRTARRAYWYGGAAAYGAAAVGAAAAAAAYAHPYYPYGYAYPRPACGYYPYPPCY
jgi:hypothetical protein